MHAPLRNLAAHTRPLDKSDDYLSEHGAHRLAATIRNYWRLRGFSPLVWVHKQFSSASPTDGDRVIYVVKSDMVGGQPKWA